MKFTGTVFFLILLSLISYSSAQLCTQFTSCPDCVVEPGCGWCESTGECLPGNALGPGGNPANCSEWFFETCLIVPCDTHRSCLSCARDPFCGWCQSTGICLEGDSSGPLFGSCRDYRFNPSQCPVPTPRPPPPPERPRPPPPARPPPARPPPARPPPARPPPARPSNSRTPSNSIFRSISAGSSVSPATLLIGLSIALIAVANLL